MSEQSKQRVNTTRQCLVAAKDLPLSCPNSESPLWSMHPRVYLPIEKSGQVICPYCGTLYVLEGHHLKS